MIQCRVPCFSPCALDGVCSNQLRGFSPLAHLLGKMREDTRRHGEVEPEPSLMKPPVCLHGAPSGVCASLDDREHALNLRARERPDQDCLGNRDRRPNLLQLSITQNRELDLAFLELDLIP